MKYLFVSLFCLLNFSSFAQFREGFDPDEVKAMLAMCNSYTFIDLYGSDEAILPKDYQKVYTSETIGMDNKFQVYKKGKVGVINFRGSTDKVSSWIENMYSAMIRAEGIMVIEKKDMPYCFAKDTAAAVHSGYALAVMLMSPSILKQIKLLNKQGIYHIMITGHSQGGALANMTRAYLENLPKGTLDAKNVFKTYAFANPMCGNEAFANEYQYRYADINMSYSIINPADLVPMMPMHYEKDGPLISKQKIKDWLMGKKQFDLKQLGMDYLIRRFEGGLKDYVGSSNRILEKFISKSYKSIDLPPYTQDINFFQTGKVRKLEPFPYPQIELDTAQLSEKEMSKLKPAEDGKYYKPEPTFFQHKPYNYYVGFLKEYFSADYRRLEPKYLPENL